MRGYLNIDSRATSRTAALQQEHEMMKSLRGYLARLRMVRLRLEIGAASQGGKVHLAQKVGVGRAVDGWGSCGFLLAPFANHGIGTAC